MSKFSTYLFEKVEQRDLKAAASDPKIEIGVEFEIITTISDDDEGVHIPNSHLDSVYNIARMQREYENMKETFEHLQVRGEDLQDKYVEDYLSPFVFDTVNPKLLTKEQELKSRMSGEHGEVLAGIEKKYKQIHRLRLDLNNAMNKLDYVKAAKLLNTNFPGLNVRDVVEWIGDNYRLQLPVVSQKLSDFFKETIGRSDFADVVRFYLEKFLRTGEYEWEDVEAEGFEEPEILAMETMNDEGKPIEPFDTIKDWEGWKGLPFDIENAQVGAYHSSKDYMAWRIENDASLNPGGIEIVSPVMPLKNGLQIIEKMFDWISANATTDESTGFHVNLSYKGKMGNLDLLKLMLFMDEGYVEKQFAGRMSGRFAQSVSSVLRNTSVIDWTEMQNQPDIKSKFAAFTKKLKGPEDKYFGINIKHANEGKASRIEFRYMGGQNYHKNYKKVEAMILRYAYLMRIAADPSYKRKEYLQKLARIFNKVET